MISFFDSTDEHGIKPMSHLPLSASQHTTSLYLSQLLPSHQYPRQIVLLAQHLPSLLPSPNSPNLYPLPLQLKLILKFQLKLQLQH